MTAPTATRQVPAIDRKALPLGSSLPWLSFGRTANAMIVTGEHDVRRNVQPRGALRSGPQQTGLRENLREGQRVRNNDQRREQIAARQDIECARARYRVLAEQQRRRNEVADEHQGLLDQDEAREIYPSGPRKRQGRQEHSKQEDANRERHTALGCSCWQ